LILGHDTQFNPLMEYYLSTWDSGHLMRKNSVYGDNGVTRDVLLKFDVSSTTTSYSKELLQHLLNCQPPKTK